MLNPAFEPKILVNFYLFTPKKIICQEKRSQASLRAESARGGEKAWQSMLTLVKV